MLLKLYVYTTFTNYNDYDAKNDRSANLNIIGKSYKISEACDVVLGKQTHSQTEREK